MSTNIRGRRARCATVASHKVAGLILKAVTPALLALSSPVRAASFVPFYDGVISGEYQHSSVAVAGAIANVPLSAGSVYNASGSSNDIVVLNYSTVVYNGSLSVLTTLERIRNGQSVYNTEDDDGGFFNFTPTELPNIPRMGMNYYMEFIVWPLMNLSGGTYDTTDTPYNSPSGVSSGDTYPGPERLLVGSAGEVYYTGDHYSTNDYVNPTSPLPPITVNSWNVSTGGNWSTASNWAGGHVPIAGEAAYLAYQTTVSHVVNNITNYDYTGPAITLGDFLVNADGTQTYENSQTFQQSQGTLTTAKEEVWARFATATVLQSGGNDTVTGALHIGQFVGSAGTYNLSGGSLTAANEYIGSTELVAAAGTGIFNQTGGTHTVTGAINLGFAAGGAGTYSLQTGTLTAAAININLGGTFNQISGTMNVTGSVVNSATAMFAGTQNYSTGATFTNNTGATATLTTDAGSLKQTLNLIAAGGLVSFNTSQHLASLAVSGGTVQLHRPGTAPIVLVAPTLTISSGQLDLTNNGLDVQGGSLLSVRNMVASAFSNGLWTGSGITSTTAAADTTHLTAVGVIQNNQSGSALFYGNTTFEGIDPGPGDILARYTYYGDANLSGKVDGSDYSLIDSGFVTHATGWGNGDFNYDGVVNGSDYTLIDNAFNSQGAKLTDEVENATPTAEVASVAAVPEPGCVALMMLGAAGLLGRRLRG